MSIDFNPLTRLRRWRQTQLLRRDCGLDLPGWALAEVSFTPVQAQWLLRSLCAWHALPLRHAAAPATAAVPLAALGPQLADLGITLRACRLADARALHAGDVLIVVDDAAQRLFGDACMQGGGLALVVAAGSQTVRLSPALAPDPLSCRCTDLQGALVGWVLRSQVRPERVRGGAAWEGTWAVAT